MPDNAQPHRGQAIPPQTCERLAHELVGDATPMMGQGEVEPSQFRRCHTFDLRVRTRPERQHAAAYVLCHLRDKQHGIGILDQRAKAFRRKFRGNIVREI